MTFSGSDSESDYVSVSFCVSGCQERRRRQETWAVAVRNEDVKLGGSAVGSVDVRNNLSLHMEESAKN